MIHLLRTTAEQPDFINLVKELDAELAIRDGADHAFYAQFNKTSLLQFVVVAYENEQFNLKFKHALKKTDRLKTRNMFRMTKYKALITTNRKQYILLAILSVVVAGMTVPSQY